MKSLRIKILLLLAAVCYWAGCNGPSTERQRIINDATTYFSLLAQTFIQFFQNDLNSCNNFLSIANGLSIIPQDCDNPPDGGFQLSIADVSCTGGSPLTASVTLTLDFTNCDDRDNKVISTGPLIFSVNFTSSEIFVNVSSPGIEVDGLEFVFSNMNVNVNFSNGNVTCEGDLTVDGETCSVNSNCDKC